MSAFFDLKERLPPSPDPRQPTHDINGNRIDPTARFIVIRPNPFIPDIIEQVLSDAAHVIGDWKTVRTQSGRAFGVRLEFCPLCDEEAEIGGGWEDRRQMRRGDALVLLNDGRLTCNADGACEATMHDVPLESWAPLACNEWSTKQIIDEILAPVRLSRVTQRTGRFGRYLSIDLRLVAPNPLAGRTVSYRLDDDRVTRVQLAMALGLPKPTDIPAFISNFKFKTLLGRAGWARVLKITHGPGAILTTGGLLSPREIGSIDDLLKEAGEEPLLAKSPDAPTPTFPPFDPKAPFV